MSGVMLCSHGEVGLEREIAIRSLETFAREINGSD